MENDRIFVSIASYRDVQLIPTLSDLIDNCSDPTRLDIHVLNQFGEECPNFKVIQEVNAKGANIQIKGVPYKNSKGVCWARHLLKSLYSGQKYYMQLDSHHRFVKDWDLSCEEMLSDLKDAGYEHPFLTAYLPSFDPYDDPNKRVMEPWQLNFDRFTLTDDCVFFKPSTMVNWRKLKLPMPSRFVSGHFIFAYGDICDVEFYHPVYFFHGEEIFMSCSLFLSARVGFNPHKVVAWHEYTRNYRGNKKVWDDMPDWHVRDKNSHKINQEFFRLIPRTRDFSKYEKTFVKSLREYEIFSGILFQSRAVQAETLACKPPPNLYTYKRRSDWLKSFIMIRRHCLDVYHKQLPDLEKLAYVAVIYKKGDQELFREDLLHKHLQPIFDERAKTGEQFYKFWTEFKHSELPDNAVVWPYIKDEGWGDRIDFTLR